LKKDTDSLSRKINQSLNVLIIIIQLN